MLSHGNLLFSSFCPVIGEFSAVSISDSFSDQDRAVLGLNTIEAGSRDLSARQSVGN